MCCDIHMKANVSLTSDQNSICRNNDSSLFNQNYTKQQNITSDTLHIVQWNVESWTKDNAYLREKILLQIKPDIISVNETFLRNEDVIHLNGYNGWDITEENYTKGQTGDQVESVYL